MISERSQNTRLVQKMQIYITVINYFLKYLHKVTDFIISSNKCSICKESMKSSFKNIYFFL